MIADTALEQEKTLHCLLEAIRAHLLHSDFALNSPVTELSNIEADVLRELYVNPELKVSELAEIVRRDKSSISRLLQKLLNDSYLSYSKTAKESDARRKSLTLTKKGIASTKKITLVFTQQIEERIQNFASIEQAEQFAALFLKFTSGTSQKIHKNIVINGIDKSLDLITRTLGITNGNFCNSGSSAIQWLMLAAWKSGSYNNTDLPRLLTISPSHFSNLIEQQRKGGLVSLSTDLEDRRKTKVTMLAKGLAELSKIESAAIKTLKEFAKAFSDEELVTFTRLFIQYIFPLAKPTTIPLDNNLYLEICQFEESELQSFRALYIQKLAKQSRSLSGYLLASQNYFIGMKNIAGSLIGIFEIAPIAKQPTELYLANYFLIDNDYSTYSIKTLASCLLLIEPRLKSVKSIMQALE